MRGSSALHQHATVPACAHAAPATCMAGGLSSQRNSARAPPGYTSVLGSVKRVGPVLLIALPGWVRRGQGISATGTGARAGGCQRCQGHRLQLAREENVRSR